MKNVKHSVIITSVTIAAVALCSAGYNATKQEQIRQTITNEISNKDLAPKTNQAFKEGEVLSYRLHYGFVDAGVAVLEVKPTILDIAGRKVYHIVGNGYTKGSFDWFFKVRDRYETYLDKNALVPWLFVRRVNEGGYIINQDYNFNHYTNKVDIGGGEKIAIPEGTQDMVSAFYAARNIDYSNAKENEIFTIPSFVDKELWPMKMRYIGKETIKTDLGKFRCLKFRPIVQKGRIFKKEEDMSVWITDDKNHIPLRAEAKVLIGAVRLDVESWKNLANETSEVK